MSFLELGRVRRAIGCLDAAGRPAATQLGAQRVMVSYSELPEGGEITFKTTDPHSLIAMHRWCGAQLPEHGADAKAE